MLSILPVRMALAIGCVFHSTSRARCRFAPRSTPGSSRWLTIARRLIASCARTSLLRVLREQVGEAGDGPLGVAGVQGGEDEVAGLGGAQGHLGRLAVADLADQDHVGVLPQAVLAGRRRTSARRRPTSRCVTTEFGRPREQVLDRLLDGDDAVAAGLVEQVDDHRQRGRLAGPGRPGDDHQPVAREGQPLGQRDAGSRPSRSPGCRPGRRASRPPSCPPAWNRLARNRAGPAVEACSNEKSAFRWSRSRSAVSAGPSRRGVGRSPRRTAPARAVPSRSPCRRRTGG